MNLKKSEIAKAVEVMDDGKVRIDLTKIPKVGEATYYALAIGSAYGTPFGAFWTYAFPGEWRLEDNAVVGRPFDSEEVEPEELKRQVVDTIHAVFAEENPLIFNLGIGDDAFLEFFLNDDGTITVRADGALEKYEPLLQKWAEEEDWKKIASLHNAVAKVVSADKELLELEEERDNDYDFSL